MDGVEQIPAIVMLLYVRFDWTLNCCKQEGPITEYTSLISIVLVIHSRHVLYIFTPFVACGPWSRTEQDESKDVQGQHHGVVQLNPTNWCHFYKHS